MNFKKILFATDFSPASDAALQYATSLARDSGALLLIAHVEELPMPYAGGEMYYRRRPISESRDPPDARGGGSRPTRAFATSTELVMGSAADDIVRHCRTKKAST